jgi:hypothetical protein
MNEIEAAIENGRQSLAEHMRQAAGNEKELALLIQKWPNYFAKKILRAVAESVPGETNGWNDCRDRFLQPIKDALSTEVEYEDS